METSDRRIQTICLVVLYLLFLLPQKQQEPALWRDIATRARAFLIAKSAVSLALGVLIGMALLASYSSLTRPVANLLSGQTVRRAPAERTE
jgi:uncharacterized membrane protein